LSLHEKHERILKEHDELSKSANAEYMMSLTEITMAKNKVEE
jgi:hypothetical protein